MTEKLTIEQIERLEEITKDDQIRKLEKLLLSSDKKAGKAVRAATESHKLLDRVKNQLGEQRKKTKTNISAYNQIMQAHEQTKLKLDKALKSAEKLDRALKSLAQVDSTDDINQWNDQEWAILKTKEMNSFRVVQLQEGFSFRISVVGGTIDFVKPTAPPKHVIEKVLELVTVSKGEI